MTIKRVFGAFVLALALSASTSLAAGKGPDPALNKAVRRLLDLPPAMHFNIEKGETTELFAQGLEYTPCKVLSADGPLGSFVRIRARWGRGPDKLVDVAALLRKGRLRSLAAVRPLRRDGGPDDGPRLDSLVGHLSDIDIERAAPALATLFRALGYLDRVSAGRPVGPRAMEGKEPRYTMKVEQALPKAGDSMPALAGKAVGASLPSSEALKGKACIVFFGDLDDGLCMEYRRLVYDLLGSAGAKKPLRFIEVYPQAPGRVLARKRVGERFAGLVVCDEKRANEKAFKLPYLPYLLGYDKKGKLRLIAPYKGSAKVKSAFGDFIATYCRRQGGSGGK